MYVINGCALEFGLPLNDVFAEVHRSNMSKLGGRQAVPAATTGRSSRPNYREADILGILGSLIQPQRRTHERQRQVHRGVRHGP